MSIAFEPAGSALYRAYAPPRRLRLSRRVALALGIAAAVHALIGYGVWNAKFRPHYEPQPVRAINAELVRPKPVPPPPPPPPPKREVHRAPRRPAVRHVSPPPPMLRPRPTRALAAIAPPPLPVAPAPPTVTPPAPPAIVAAPPPPPKPPERAHIITNPDWLRTPDGDDLARYYPEEAQRQGIGGEATISCSVSEAGSLVGCSVASEAPKDQGFGRAALKMAGDFKMRPETRDGVPVAGGKIRIPIRFRMPDEGQG